MYTDFSSVYDFLMRDVDYEGWAARYARMLGSAPQRVTECACGTGAITVPLAKMGYSMTGADLSDDMLERAMVRARKEGVSIPFVRQDMRHIAAARRQDAILATCDGVNYLTDEKSVKEFFSGAFSCLKPGGKLLFDISSAYKLENILGNNTLTLDEEDAAYIWQNTFHPKTRTVDLDLSIFIREGENAFRRVREGQTQRAHTAAEMEKWLTECGYGGISFSGTKENAAPGEKDERIFISAVKPL